MSDLTVQQIYYPDICFSNAMNAVKDKNVKRLDMAMFYADCIRANLSEWGELNRAIIERWSKSGLIYVKEQAWKLILIKSVNEGK